MKYLNHTHFLSLVNFPLLFECSPFYFVKTSEDKQMFRQHWLPVCALH